MSCSPDIKVQLPVTIDLESYFHLQNEMLDVKTGLSPLVDHTGMAAEQVGLASVDVKSYFPMCALSP